MLATAHNGELTTSGDIQNEFQAMVSGCGIYGLSSRAKINLTGTDRVRWLNGMVTNNIRDLSVGRGVYAFLLNPQGRILGDLYAFNRGESILLDTDQAQVANILKTFDHYIIMDDVEVENFGGKLTAIGLSGPNAATVLQSAGLDVTRLERLELRGLQWGEVSLTVMRSETEKRESYEIWLAPEDVSQLCNALVAKGAIPVSDAAQELYRVALGIPRYGQDIRERDLPQETEQARALNFSKGCYVGQEIVERIRSRGAVHRTFTGFVFDGNSPEPGSKIQADGKDVGEITTALALPLKSGVTRVALGYIRREAISSGNEIFANGVKATIAELPFKVVFA